MRKFFALGLCLFIFNAFSQVRFLEVDFENALAQAKSANKLVFLDFRADWCKPCVEMEKTTYLDRIVSEILNTNYVPLKIDVDYFTGMDLKERYNVNTLPTMLLINAYGEVQKRIIGFKDASSLISELGNTSEHIENNELPIEQPKKPNSTPQKTCFLKNWFKK